METGFFVGVIAFIVEVFLAVGTFVFLLALVKKRVLLGWRKLLVPQILIFACGIIAFSFSFPFVLNNINRTDSNNNSWLILAGLAIAIPVVALATNWILIHWLGRRSRK